MNYSEGHTHPGFYGNYKPEAVPLLKQAADETGFEIEVLDNARDVNGNPVPGFVAVYVKGELRDRSPLWRRYRELEVEVQARATNRDERTEP